MSTMLDVSKKAGVSKSTVSRVLNGSNRISKETQAAVFKAIEELNYRPNVLAQSLSKKETNTIGLIIPRGASTSRYLAMLIDQCDSMIDNAGKFLLMTQVKDHPDGIINSIRALVDRKCDGVLYYNNSFFDQNNVTSQLLNETISSLPVPLVVMNCQLESHIDSCVWFDHSKIASLPVEHLLAHGHKKIAYISGPLNQLTAKLRLQGYQNALNNAGIALDPLLIAEGNRFYDGGYNACKQLLKRDLDITAICCFNDQVAIGAMKALHDEKITVPDEISLFGIDDEAVLDYWIPSISSVSLPVKELASCAVELLLSQTNTSSQHHEINREFSAKLVLRQSFRSLI